MDWLKHKANELAHWFLSLDNEGKLICGGVLLVLIVLLLKPRRRSRRDGYRDRNYRAVDDFTVYQDVRYLRLPFMSQTEINFWGLLVRAAAGYHIFPQVATSALLNIESPEPKHFRTVLRAFSTTRIDFVICDAQLRVVALVELDDVSHDDKKEKDRRRDFITAQAGYKTVRFDCRQWPSVEQIRKRIFEA